MTWAASGFFSGNDSAFSFFTAVPFGPDPGEYMAWLYYGDGMKLMNEMFSKYNIHAIPCGIQPPEASGWFRKEINSVEDFDEYGNIKFSFIFNPIILDTPIAI